MTRCENCGAIATHFCTACRKWLCDGPRCNLKSAAVAIIRHPVNSAKVVFGRVPWRA